METKVEAAEDEVESYIHAVQLMTSMSVPISLHAAMELGVFDIIHKSGPCAKLSAKDIARHINSSNPDAATMLDRILMLLSAHSVLRCTLADGSSQRLYSLNSLSKFYVPNEDGDSLRPVMSFFQDKVYLQSWSQLKEAILEGGIPFNRVHGMHLFEYPGVDSRVNQIINAAMSSWTGLASKKIVESYKGFEHINELVDVGGGIGTTLHFIVSKYPHIRGVNFDLPHVIREAPSYPGVKHIGGDMFKSVPQGDAILLKHILHDWSDERCLKLLKNCYNAIHDHDDGKVIVVDRVVPTVPETSIMGKTACQNDIFMMTLCPGGKERNEQEFTELATKSGFKGIKFACFAYDLMVMEFYK